MRTVFGRLGHVPRLERRQNPAHAPQCLACACRSRLAPQGRRADQGRARHGQRRGGAAEHVRCGDRRGAPRRPAAREAAPGLRPPLQARRAPSRRRATPRAGAQSSSWSIIRLASSPSAGSMPTRPVRCSSRTTESWRIASPIRSTRSTRSTRSRRGRSRATPTSSGCARESSSTTDRRARPRYAASQAPASSSRSTKAATVRSSACSKRSGTACAHCIGAATGRSRSKGSSPARGASSSPPRWSGCAVLRGGIRRRESMGLVEQALGLADPVLRLTLVEHPVAGCRIVQRLPDLAGEHVPLQRQVRDGCLDRVVLERVTRLQRCGRRDERVGCELSERRVDLLVGVAQILGRMSRC